MEASHQVCYRHPNRETNVSCSNCGNPICTDCMTPSPVGMRCPDCANERQQVYTRADITPGPIAAAWREMPATTALIAINIAVLLLQIGSGGEIALFSGRALGSIGEQGVFNGPAIASGEYWRVIASGFLHFGLLHVALNIWVLFVLGRMIEPILGAVQTVAIYVTSLIAGSLGVMILTPNSFTAGASGAVFGLMGFALIVAWASRNRLALQEIIFSIVVNLVLTFQFSFISKGGHLGGLLGGVACGLILIKFGERFGLVGATGRRRWIGTSIIAVLGVGMYVACIAIARHEFPQSVS